jgi:hypothetical protein
LEIEKSSQNKNKVLLTKDNLARKKWQGCKECCLCDSDETHPFARIVWRIVLIAYNISPPTNIANMFGN